MRRPIVILLSAIAGIVVIVLAAVAIVVSTVDLNRFMAPLEAKVKAETGRDLAIDGPVEFKLSLTPTIVVEDVKLGDAPWAAGREFVTAKRVEAQLALVPLLSRKFEIVELTLVNPTIALETDAQGRGNWEFASAGTASGGTSGATPANLPSAGAAAAAASLGVGTLSLRDGALTYRDGASGKLTSVAIESLVVHARSGATPIDASFRGRIDDVPIAIAGNFGSLEQLRARNWPYPIALRGQVNGRDVTLSTKLAQRPSVTELAELDLSLGETIVRGSLRIDTSGARPLYRIELDIPKLALADAPLLAAPAARTAASSPPAGEASRYLIPDTPLPLAGLRTVDAIGHVAIGELVAANGVRASAISADFTLKDGKFTAPALHATLFGGTLAGSVALEIEPANASLRVHLDGRDLELASIMAAAGAPRELRGGKTRLAVDLASRGSSAHQWAASATGNVVLAVGPATLENGKLDLASSVNRLSDALNPFRAGDATTELVCVVVRLPLSSGVARIDRSIAGETSKIGVSASGTLDFRDETLDLSFHPQVRQGVVIAIPQVAELVRYKGNFRSPQVTIDATRTAETVVRLGAAIYTGGLSVLGESVLRTTTEGGPGPCAIAMGGARESSANSAQHAPAANPTDAIGDALGKLLRR
jgi:uncharacterized protein involved in outer membrane biogenesis